MVRQYFFLGKGGLLVRNVIGIIYDSEFFEDTIYVEFFANEYYVI